MKYETGHYSFDFNSEGFTVKFKGLSLFTHIRKAVIGSLFSLVVLWVSILAISSKELFYAITFSLFFLFLIYYIFWLDIFRWIIRKKRFMFKLNIDGIFCSEINKSYFIGWDELEYFGFVERNPINVANRDLFFQTCIYFSNNIIEEKQMRKRCRYLDDLPYMHNSSNEMIVFGFLDVFVDEGFADKYPDMRLSDEFLEKIRTAICMYVEPSKEKDFLDR